jgi:hypothetical protein
MNKINELISRCKASVSITANNHRDYYQSVEDYIKEIEAMQNDLNIPADVLRRMIETNTVIELQFYPNTPVSFYIIYHYSLDIAIDEALNSLTS